MCCVCMLRCSVLCVAAYHGEPGSSCCSPVSPSRACTYTPAVRQSRVGATNSLLSCATVPLMSWPRCRQHDESRSAHGGGAAAGHSVRTCTGGAGWAGGCPGDCGCPIGWPGGWAGEGVGCRPHVRTRAYGTSVAADPTSSRAKAPTPRHRARARFTRRLALRKRCRTRAQVKGAGEDSSVPLPPPAEPATSRGARVRAVALLSAGSERGSSREDVGRERSGKAWCPLIPRRKLKLGKCVNTAVKRS